MKDLIDKKYYNSLWKDQCGDQLLLLRYAEVYRCAENTLRVVSWSPYKISKLKKMKITFNEDSTDDELYIVETDVKNIDILIELGIYKRRPNLDGEWLKDKIERISHALIPYNPA